MFSIRLLYKLHDSEISVFSIIFVKYEVLKQLSSHVSQSHTSRHTHEVNSHSFYVTLMSHLKQNEDQARHLHVTNLDPPAVVGCNELNLLRYIT